MDSPNHHNGFDAVTAEDPVRPASPGKTLATSAAVDGQGGYHNPDESANGTQEARKGPLIVSIPILVFHFCHGPF